jgi:hypothetical protein
MVEVQDIMKQQPWKEDSYRQAQASLMEKGDREHLFGKRQRSTTIFRNAGYVGHGEEHDHPLCTHFGVRDNSVSHDILRSG